MVCECAGSRQIHILDFGCQENSRFPSLGCYSFLSELDLSYYRFGDARNTLAITFSYDFDLCFSSFTKIFIKPPKKQKNLLKNHFIIETLKSDHISLSSDSETMKEKCASKRLEQEKINTGEICFKFLHYLLWKYFYGIFRQLS